MKIQKKYTKIPNVNKFN